MRRSFEPPLQREPTRRAEPGCNIETFYLYTCRPWLLAFAESMGMAWSSSERTPRSLEGVHGLNTPRVPSSCVRPRFGQRACADIILAAENDLGDRALDQGGPECEEGKWPGKSLILILLYLFNSFFSPSVPTAADRDRPGQPIPW